MKIVVCIKQVPDTANVRIDPVTNTLVREGVESIINPFDTYAIEEGIALREKHGGEAIVLSMGPPQAAEALREAISMGADRAILLSDRALAGGDTWSTSLTIAAAVRKIGEVDLVICGKQAIDGDTAQVGPEVSHLLGWSLAAFCSAVREVGAGFAVVERLTDYGKQVIRLPLPGVVTVVKDINSPRLPSLRGKLRAKKEEIPVWGIADLGLAAAEVGLQGSPTKVIHTFTPAPRSGGRVLKGDPEEAAAAVVELVAGIISGGGPAK